MDEITSLLLHLSLIEGVGAAAIQKIIQEFGEQMQSVYHVSAQQLASRCGFTPSYAQKISVGLQDHQPLKQELDLIQKHGVSIVTLLDAVYPELLKSIYLPPPVVYVRGSASLLQSDSIAIVGSRKADGYGQRVINALVPELVAAQLTIVSGGALGADSFAHRAALANGGKTVAILGSGLLRLYPASNKRLFEEIVSKGGSLVSPFALRADPLPGNFPARNRIIAGLSRGCIVAQADTKSGASITARFALEQGREVFAVPGSIENPLSSGCHQLIKDGATLVVNAHDILQQLLPGYMPANDTKNSEMAPAQLDIVHASKQNSANISFSHSAHQRIYELCKEPRLLDELIEKMALPMSELQEHLFDMQIQGLLEQDFIGRWQIF